MSPARYLALLVCSVLTLVAFAGGCGSTMKDTLKVEDTLAVATSQLAHAVDGADAFLEVKTRARMATDADGARAAYAGYKPKIENARAAVHTSQATLHDADSVRQSIPRGGDEKTFTAWMPTLASVLALVEAAYANLNGLVQK